MPITITTTVYTIDELEGKAKENARNWGRDIYIHDPFWKGEHFQSKTEIIKWVRNAYDQYSQTWDYDKIRNIIKKAEENSFTGYCADSDALEILNDILTGEDKLCDVIHDINSKYQNGWELEMESALEDENIDEFLRGNDYTFTKNGVRFCS